VFKIEDFILPLTFFVAANLHYTHLNFILILQSVSVGPKRDEATEVWRKRHNEELHDLYSPPCIVRVIKSRRMRRAEHVARMGEGRGVYRVLVRKPERKRPLGRPRCR
jgi:hypothetical protein